MSSQFTRWLVAVGLLIGIVGVAFGICWLAVTYPVVLCIGYLVVVVSLLVYVLKSVVDMFFEGRGVK